MPDHAATWPSARRMRKIGAGCCVWRKRAKSSHVRPNSCRGTCDDHVRHCTPVNVLPRRLLLPVRPGVCADDPAAGADHAGTEGGHRDLIRPAIGAQHRLVGGIASDRRRATARRAGACCRASSARSAGRSGPSAIVAERRVEHRAAVGRQHEPFGSVTVDQATNNHLRDRRPGDIGPGPFGAAGEAEQQDALSASLAEN
jgi:hypothetical protein